MALSSGILVHMTDAQLEGRVAVVTGASRGIGQAIASSLLSEGVDVVMSSRSTNALSQAVDQLASAASSGRRARVEPFPADVRDSAQMQALMAKAIDTFGRLDVLINNAGVGLFHPVAELSVADWETVIETNLSGVFFACRAAIPLLQRGGGGWIINISSLAGSHPFGGGAAYCASKAGLNALTEVLMQELRHDDIRVSCVAPGSVDTDFAGGNKGASASWKLDQDDVARVVLDLLRHNPRSLPSRVEIRPSRPQE